MIRLQNDRQLQIPWALTANEIDYKTARSSQDFICEQDYLNLL